MKGCELQPGTLCYVEVTEVGGGGEQGEHVHLGRGRIRGRIRGRNRGRIKGRIRGKIKGRIRGRIRSRIRGRNRGRIRGRRGSRRRLKQDEDDGNTSARCGPLEPAILKDGSALIQEARRRRRSPEAVSRGPRSRGRSTCRRLGVRDLGLQRSAIYEILMILPRLM